MADKFRLLIDHNAKSKEEIAKELKRIIGLKTAADIMQPSAEHETSGGERQDLTDVIKRAVTDKISSIVREAIETARENTAERSYGEKIPPKAKRENVDYRGESPSVSADELAYSPSMYEDEDDGAIRTRIAEMRRLSQTFYNGYMLRQCAEETLVKQGEYMKDVTDDYGRNCFCGIERPIYGAMSTDQLRTYFTWRTNARRGVFGTVDKPYIMLYCYELLNKIGVLSSADAYNRLCAVWENCRSFCPALDAVMPRWLKDFRAFNDVGEAGEPCPAENSSTADAGTDDEDILCRRYSGKLEFLMGRSSYNLRGSIFFSEETSPLLDGALEAALTALDGYFSDKGIMLFELICGRLKKDYNWEPFSGAYVDLDRMDGFHSLKISPMEQYCTKRGQPCLERFEEAPYRNLVGWILKSTEAVLRKRTGFRYSISPNLTPVLEDMTNRERLFKAVSDPGFADIVTRAVGEWCDRNNIFPPKKQKKRSQGYNFDEEPDSTAAKEPPKPLEIDISKLAMIREQSDETARKLIIEEADTLTEDEITEKIQEIEAENFQEQAESCTQDHGAISDSSAQSADNAVFGALPDGWREFACCLSEQDISLLKALLDGTAEALCRRQGVMPETEYDRINSAAMENIGDVLIENGGIIEDYRADTERICELSDGKRDR